MISTKYIFYDKTKTYLYPNMKLATPESVQENYPGVFVFKHVISTNNAEEIIYGFENFSTLKSRYNINNSLNDEEALTEINRISKEQKEERENQELEPTAEERIAAALEFQNLQSL